MTPCIRTARQMTDLDLLHVLGHLNASLTAFMATGKPGTQAHAGMLEMAAACSSELDSRGYYRGAPADGRNLPVLVQWEDGVVKLSRPVLVF